MPFQSVSRSPWTLREDDFPIDRPAAERARFLLRYAILAPSSKNTQPWKFRIDAHTIHVQPDLTRWQQVADPDQRELHISLGCALENLIVAADHFGYVCTVAYGPKDGGAADAVASVTVRPAPAGAPRMRPTGLFAGLTSRQTINEPFTARRLPPAVRRQIERLSTDPDVRLLLTDDRATNRAFDAANAEADLSERGERAYRRELAHWVGQGVLGTSWAVSKLGQLALPHMNNGRAVARRDSAVLSSAPLVGLIGTTTDDRTVQVKAGQLFECVCLMAALLGLNVHPMSQTLQIPTLRTQVARLFDRTPLFAQQPFRIGYAAPRRRHHTPRRPVDEVVV
jgi:hypothetical protein